MSSTKFSYGLSLKKAGPAKRSGPPKRKAIFGGGDDDSDDDTATRGQQPKDGPIEEKITEIGDDFLSFSTPTGGSEDGRRRPGGPGAAARKNHAPAPPPALVSRRSKPDSTAQFGGDLSTALTARKYAEEAEALDPSIYDYDAAYDTLKAVSRKKAAAEETKEKKSQYMANVRKMAEVRERDRLIAEDKKMQRERETEGDAFADKEQFVTEAYKQQQAENRRLEAAEQLREEEEARKAGASGGMTGFYKELLARDEQRQAAIEEAMRRGGAEKTAASSAADEDKDNNNNVDNDDDDDDVDVERASAAKAREINARGGAVVVNEEGEVVDKRQLLRGGLNISGRKQAELARERERRRHDDDEKRQGGLLGKAGRSQGHFAAGGKQGMRGRQSRMLEAQYEQTLKRAREAEEEQVQAAQEAAKTRKTAADISSAKERYLARKRAEAEAKKKEGGS